MSNYRDQHNQSFADHLLQDGRVVSHAWFPETYMQLCAFVFIHALVCMRCNSAKHQQHVIKVTSVNIISVDVWFTHTHTYTHSHTHLNTGCFEPSLTYTHTHTHTQTSTHTHTHTNTYTHIHQHTHTYTYLVL